jgi:predicted dehydrogenase
MLRLGLVGRGRWGANIERTLTTFRDVDVVCISRKEQPLLDLDGVLIATPSSTHADIALPYIEVGIATFIEKPMATSVADAQRLVAAANRSGAPVSIGHILLHHPAFAALLERLPDLGRISQVEAFSMNDRPRKDTSVLWDWLPHHLSTGHAIFGRFPRAVEARDLSGGAASAASVNFDFDGASMACNVSWLSAVAQSRIRVTGERGVLEFNDKAADKLIFYDHAGTTQRLAYASDPPLTCELAAFLNVVRTRSRDQTEINRGLAIVRAIDAAQRSILAAGKSIDLGLDSVI